MVESTKHFYALHSNCVSDRDILFYDTIKAKNPAEPLPW